VVSICYGERKARFMAIAVSIPRYLLEGGDG